MLQINDLRSVGSQEVYIIQQENFQMKFLLILQLVQGSESRNIK